MLCNILLNLVNATQILDKFVVLNCLEKHVVFNHFPFAGCANFFELGEFFVFHSSWIDLFDESPGLLLNFFGNV